MTEITTGTETSKPATRLKVPSTAQQIPRLAHYQMRQYLQSRRFLALVVIVVAIGAIFSAVVAIYHSSFITSDSVSFYGGSWAGGVGVVIVLAAVFFGGDAIAGEFQNKTGYFLMSVPIRRATVYAGKFLAAFLTSVAIITIFFAIVLGNGIYYFGASAFPWQLFFSLPIVILYLLAVLGTTFLFSSLFKTSAYGFVLTIILFLFGFTILQDLVAILIKIEPWMVISYASGILSDLFSSPINWGLTATLGPVPAYDSPGIAEGVVIMLGYFILTAIAGLLLFEREEFK